MDRHFVRTVIMQLVYSSLLGGNQQPKTLAMLYGKKTLSPEAQQRITEATNVIARVGIGMDNHIDGWSVNWSVERIPKVVLSILRFGMYELIYLPTPPAVTINECVELAWEFAHDEAVPYINGLLSTCLRELQDGRLTMESLEAESALLNQEAERRAAVEAAAAAEKLLIKNAAAEAEAEMERLDLADDILSSYEYMRSLRDTKKNAVICAETDD
ncbi:MAG: transcription antitermination protein NusB [Christensenellales bacterium]|jgi:N utilization substance protein B